MLTSHAWMMSLEKVSIHKTGEAALCDRNNHAMIQAGGAQRLCPRAGQAEGGKLIAKKRMGRSQGMEASALTPRVTVEHDILSFESEFRINQRGPTHIERRSGPRPSLNRNRKTIAARTAPNASNRPSNRNMCPVIVSHIALRVATSSTARLKAVDVILFSIIVHLSTGIDGSILYRIDR
jgi:hypothetical protein